MGIDEQLAGRVRKTIPADVRFTESRMFGGLTFMLGGKMTCGISETDLMVRVGPQQYEQALREPGARPMDFTGRPLRGFVFVGPAGTRGDRALRAWIRKGREFVRSLPPEDRGKRSDTERPR